MRRAMTMKNLYDKKHDLFEFDGVLLDVLGAPEKNGAWLIWGAEKNGKTWFTLLLSNYLSQFERVHYISAEEGAGSDFIDTCRRAKISPLNNRLHINEYESLDELYNRLKIRGAPKITVIDNITVYNEELKNGALRKLLLDFPEVLFIFLAHEERGEPYTATAKLVRRLAKRIFHIQGLACTVEGRCQGGTIIIDEERAALYHGQQVLKKA